MLAIYYWDAADTVRKEQNAPLPSLNQACHDRESATVRARVTSDTWNIVWEQGTQQLLNKVVEAVLSELQFFYVLAMCIALQVTYIG